jgi:hypothetical protein
MVLTIHPLSHLRSYWRPTCAASTGATSHTWLLKFIQNLVALVIFQVFQGHVCLTISQGRADYRIPPSSQKVLWDSTSLDSCCPSPSPATVIKPCGSNFSTSFGFVHLPLVCLRCQCLRSGLHLWPVMTRAP